MDHIKDKQQQINSQIYGSYKIESNAPNTPPAQIEKGEQDQLFDSNPFAEITKGEIFDYLEKGGKRAMIGERRMFGGREYIKTATGWKFHGKGTGAKTKEHRDGAAAHIREQRTAERSDSKKKTTSDSKSFTDHVIDYKDKNPRASLTEAEAYAKKATEHRTAEGDKKAPLDSTKKTSSSLKAEDVYKEIQSTYKSSSMSSASAEVLKTLEKLGVPNSDTLRKVLDKRSHYDSIRSRNAFIKQAIKDHLKSSSSTSSKHIGDMSESEIKEQASKRGISTEGKTKAQLQKELTDHNVKASMEDFKARKAGKKNLTDLSKEEYDKAVSDTAKKLIANTSKTTRRYLGEYEHESFTSPFGKDSASKEAQGRDKFIEDVDKHVAKLKRANKRDSQAGKVDSPSTKKEGQKSKREVAPEGTIKEMGGRKYIKKDGKWKYYSDKPAKPKTLAPKEPKTGDYYAAPTRKMAVAKPRSISSKDYAPKDVNEITRDVKREFGHFSLGDQKRKITELTEKHFGKSRSAEKKAPFTESSIKEALGSTISGMKMTDADPSGDGKSFSAYVETGSRGPRTDHGGGPSGDDWMSHDQVENLRKSYLIQYKSKIQAIEKQLKSKGLKNVKVDLNYGEKGHVGLHIRASKK